MNIKKLIIIALISMTACPVIIRRSSLDEEGTRMEYRMDKRTNICFAFYRGWYGFAEVECTPEVLKLIETRLCEEAKGKCLHLD